MSCVPHAGSSCYRLLYKSNARLTSLVLLGPLSDVTLQGPRVSKRPKKSSSHSIHVGEALGLEG